MVLVRAAYGKKARTDPRLSFFPCGPPADWSIQVFWPMMDLRVDGLVGGAVSTASLLPFLGVLGARQVNTGFATQPPMRGQSYYALM